MANFTLRIPDVTDVLVFISQHLDFNLTVAPGMLDEVPPVVTLISPADGSSLEKNQPITIEVEDESELGLHYVLARYPDTMGLYEVVYDGFDISLGAYVVTRTVLTSKRFRYTFVRRGGWLSRPIITARATDKGTGETF